MVFVVIMIMSLFGLYFVVQEMFYSSGLAHQYGITQGHDAPHWQHFSCNCTINLVYSLRPSDVQYLLS